MTSHPQRFCPLCNRAFNSGEAVLRCAGCDVLHHPGCWVKNDGCATHTDHEARPVAIAYDNRETVMAPPHPAEGTRILKPQKPAEGLLPPGSEAGDDGDAVIGATPPAAIGGTAPLPLPPPGRTQEPTRFVRREPPPPEPLHPPSAPKRYVPAPPSPQAGGPKPLPKIYGRHGILGLWYVPVAALIAVGVAFGVVWAFDQLGGGDDNGTPAVTTTVTPQPTADGTPNASATVGTRTPGASPTTAGTPAATGKFRPGDFAVVTGTGDCLNIRVAPGRNNDAIECLKDGETLAITGGPSTADGLTWWKVKIGTGEGWGAEDYLSKKP
ncbi:MAG: SH3 domain-containing protein [Chloroflexi bacterium]|nr:SH3 domain-containing protein [Chloroflexota bacterium]